MTCYFKIVSSNPAAVDLLSKWIGNFSHKLVENKLQRDWFPLKTFLRLLVGMAT